MNIQGKDRAEPPHPHPAFALVVTVSVLALLALIALGLLSLSTVTIRTSARSDAMEEAEANARLALVIALGELQKQAGPDQRVTGTAGLVEKVQHKAARHWTAAWDTGEADGGPIWLVSGNEDGTLGLEAAKNGLLFVTHQDHEVRVPAVAFKKIGKQSGRYAWWIADEGVKARVDIEQPSGDPLNKTERFVRSRLPMETGVHHVAPDLEPLGPDGDIDRTTLLTASSLALALGKRDLPIRYLHDFTTGGRGLPVNVVDGGMKKDLSLIFDSSQTRNGFAQTYLGIGSGGVPSDPRRFFLLDELTDNGRLQVGPNWGILSSYANHWGRVSGQSVDLAGLNPMPQTDIRTNDWPPYRNDTEGPWRTDRQHFNSSLTPVMAFLQMGFRLKAEERPGTNPQTGRPEPKYQLQLEMKPVVGLWNPYNVKIKRAEYRFDWALYPYLRIGIDSPSRASSTARIWMREHWLSGTGSGASPETSQARWFQMRTAQIDLQPGEFRLFSVKTGSKMGNVNRLEAGWNEEGAFRFDLVTSRFDAGRNAGRPIVVSRGSTAWYEDLFLEDAQHQETQAQYPGGFEEGASASWITVKSGGDVIHRISDLWVTPRADERPDFPVPEQVSSEASGNSSPKIPVEQLAQAPWHIGTWSWFLRTTTEAEDNQDLRGWIDTNVRLVAANPTWDGSRIKPDGTYEGWFFNTSMLGGSFPASYDNGPRGRGKIAEGAIGDETPQTPGGARFQGYGGASTTALKGQTHVAIFDVPRAPLVSIGQFQHAQVARYGYEPSFVVGNSYANPRLPLDEVAVENYAGIPGFTMLDLSYRMNEKLWDDYFFSTLGVDYVRGRNTLNRSFPVEELLSGVRTLPNPRHHFLLAPGEKSLDEIVKEAGPEAPEAIPARIMVEGAFNVNSTSRAAWKAFLSSLADFEFPALSNDGRILSWETNDGVRFPRFGHVLDADGHEPAEGAGDPGFWLGFRRISREELDQLAAKIVEEVSERGPFRSLAEFVNRDPDSSRLESQRKGALQAALDQTVNANLEALGGNVTQPGGEFSNAYDGESETAGQAGYVLQGDLLQSLGPLMQVRSDYFRIRAMGEATDANGKVLARAWCEAYVQRVPDYVDPGDLPRIPHARLKSSLNEKFGRRFRLVSFRWLSGEEV